MSSFERALREVFVRLDAHGVHGALIGGLAVSAHTEPRFTCDVDLAVSVSGDPEAERLVFALQRDGYRVLSQLEHETTGRLSSPFRTPIPGRGAGRIPEPRGSGVRGRQRAGGEGDWRAEREGVREGVHEGNRQVKRERDRGVTRVRTALCGLQADGVAAEVRDAVAARPALPELVVDLAGCPVIDTLGLGALADAGNG